MEKRYGIHVKKQSRKDPRAAEEEEEGEVTAFRKSSKARGFLEIFTDT